MSCTSLIYGNYINGKWTKGEHSTVIFDKYKRSEMGTAFLANALEVELAIKSNVDAFKAFSKWSAGDRYILLEKLIGKLSEKREYFAQLISKEVGKPYFYAKAEVERSLVTLEFSKEEARRQCGEIVPMDFSHGVGKTALTKRFPLGPIIGISPFNFPLNLALHKLGPALASGCSITLKPSPMAPLTLLSFAKLLEEVFKEMNAPDGLVNILLCSDQLSEVLVRDERFKLLSFTGSSSVGWKLKGLSGKKKVLLELGGNAAVIVDSQCDLDLAAKNIAMGAFLYAGQICISTQRIFVDEKIEKEFTKKLLGFVEQIKCGDPENDDTIVGPLISEDHFHRIESWVKVAKENGAHSLAGGVPFDRERLIFAPTILVDVKKNMDVWRREVFGPVAVLSSFHKFEDVLSEVNESDFGLQAGVFTDSISKAKLAFETLEVGGVIINNIPGFRIDNMPYGGVKDSGLGREGIKYSIDEMTEPRLLVF